MKSKKIFNLALLLVLVTMIMKSCSVQPSLKVGVGETVITPDKNIQMAGFARSQMSTGIHDDLHARSLVIEDTHDNSVLLMTISLVGLSSQMAEEISKQVYENTGIPVGKILISATHTHSGPRIEELSPYADLVIKKCVESAVIAWNTRAPGRVGIESTEVFELGRNRRRLLYGGLHPDPEVGVIKIEDRKGRLLGIAFNYGCHPSGLDWQNTLISEDWPYYAICGIKKAVGKDIWVAYFQGAEGNINIGYSADLSAIGAEMPIRNYWYIEKKGSQMADAVLKVLSTIKTDNNHTVEVAHDNFEYPLRESYPLTIAEAEQSLSKAVETLEILESNPEFHLSRTIDNARVGVFAENQKLNAAKRFFEENSLSKKTTLQQHAIRIGDAVFVTFPGELFAEIGLKIKNISPYDKTFILGITPGSRGYLPAASEFIDGDYEVNGSIYGPQTEEACIEFSTKLINEVAN